MLNQRFMANPQKHKVNGTPGAVHPLEGQIQEQFTLSNIFACLKEQGQHVDTKPTTCFQNFPPHSTIDYRTILSGLANRSCSISSRRDQKEEEEHCDRTQTIKKLNY